MQRIDIRGHESVVSGRVSVFCTGNACVRALEGASLQGKVKENKSENSYVQMESWPTIEKKD